MRFVFYALANPDGPLSYEQSIGPQDLARCGSCSTPSRAGVQKGSTLPDSAAVDRLYRLRNMADRSLLWFWDRRCARRSRTSWALSSGRGLQGAEAQGEVTVVSRSARSYLGEAVSVQFRRDH